MRKKIWIILYFQMLLLGSAILLGYWVDMPWFVLGPMFVCGMGILDSSVAGIRGSHSGDEWRLRVAWGCALLVPVGLFFSTEKPENRDLGFIGVAGVMAAATLGRRFFQPRSKSEAGWKRLSVSWGKIAS